MLLQTNSYVVPKDKRQEHERLIRRIRQALGRIGCDHFEVYEQVGGNWAPIKGGGRFIQVMRFRDRQHHHEIQELEKNDPSIQQLISDFMQLIDLPSQQEEGLFAMGHYASMSGGAAHESTSMERASMPMSQPPPGEPPAQEDVERIADLDHEHDAGGNNKPPQHEESEF